VAERVGVRAPSLYNHFPSKESLYAAVLERGIGPLLSLLRRAAADARDSDRLVGEIMAVLARHPHLPRLVLHETLGGGPRLTPMLRGWVGPALARAGELVAASPAARRFGPEQVPLVVLALYHVVLGYFTVADVYRQLGGGDLLAEEALARQTRFLRDLVAALFEDQER
jgi:AcrR family transcriptional regulator